MSRLPDLERALLDAAHRLETDPDGQRPPARDPSRPRRHRRSTPLLAGIAALLIAGGATAAVSGLLPEGDPVPSSANRGGLPEATTDTLHLMAVRVADPDGGPAWGLATFDAAAGSPPRTRAKRRSTTICAVVGRVQAGRLGVVGRDGVFADDGRFHPLSARAQSSFACGGRDPARPFVSFSLVAPIPASGYTGASGTAIGGCRERVNLDGPTVSPQTRRILKDVPQCARASMRRVVAGFAGSNAREATLKVGGVQRKQRLRAAEDGAYLFVLASSSTAPVQLRLTTRTGRVCEPFVHPPARQPGCDELFGVKLAASQGLETTQTVSDAGAETPHKVPDPPSRTGTATGDSP